MCDAPDHPAQFCACDTLRSKGVRPTRQRELIFSTLASTDSHPTAEELFAMVRESDPGLSLATVYNTLEALNQAGLCQKLPPIGHGAAWRYDADTSEHVHATTPDGRWVDLPHDLSDRLLASLDKDSLAAIETATGARVARIAVQLTIEPAPAPSAAAQTAQDRQTLGR